ncbi:DNA-directed RNA polymerase II subunit 1 [Tanacetum coccineum]
MELLLTLSLNSLSCCSSMLLLNELPGFCRISQATQRSGRPIKSICSRLNAKEGRIRGNPIGKSVDFSARTTITPDITINIDQLGVPWSIALNLTYPETVTPYNIERLKELVDYNPHPPSPTPHLVKPKLSIIKEDGQRLDLRYLKKCSDQYLEFRYKARFFAKTSKVDLSRPSDMHPMEIVEAVNKLQERLRVRCYGASPDYSPSSPQYSRSAPGYSPSSTSQYTPSMSYKDKDGPRKTINFTRIMYAHSDLPFVSWKIMTTSVENNSVLRSFFEKQKLTGPNFIDWYRQLRLQVPPEALAAHAAWVKWQKEVAMLMLLTMDLDMQQNLAHLGAYDMLQELKAMFSKQA